MRRTIARVLLAVAALVGCLWLLAGCSSQSSSNSDAARAESFATAPAEASFEAPEPEAFYILVLGNDTRAGTVGNGVAYEEREPFDCRTDTMMLVRIDPANYLISIVSIPRDTMMHRGEEAWKINTAYYGGYDEVYRQVELLTGVRADYYVEMGFATFIGFVDELGGIPIDVAVDTVYADMLHGGTKSVGAGYQVLDGAAALGVARMRKDYAEDQDACRQIQDRKLVVGGISKVLDDPALVDLAIDAFFAYVETDWPRDRLEALIRDFAAHADKVHFRAGTGPYDGRWFDEYGEFSEWYTYRDEETWAEVMRVVDEGGDPTSVVPLPTVAAM